MRKLVLCLMVFVLWSTSAFAQTWYPTNQKTLGWDPVIVLEDNSPLPAGDTVRYQIYSVISSDVAKAGKVNMGSSTQPSFIITFTTEGRYFVGVEAERLDPSGAVISKSVISWSDNPVVCSSGTTFGIIYFKAPKGIGGLKP